MRNLDHSGLPVLNQVAIPIPYVTMILILLRGVSAMEILGKVFAYWDLNRPWKTPKRIFSVQRAKLEGVETASESPTSEKGLSFWDQIWMYVGTVVGVLLSFLLRKMDSGETPELSAFLTWFHVVFSAGVGLVIIPYAYRRIDADPTTPFIVRFGLFVQNGAFWQVIMGLIGKTFT
jgi:hypothetical protein